MDNRFSKADRELYKRVDEVLFYIWDPIGVSDTPEARDEYNSYLGVVFSMLKQNKSANEIATYLTQIACDRMEFKVSADSKKHDLEVATLLQKHKQFVANQFSASE